MLLKGLNHVATITNDAPRLVAFYEEAFEAEVLRDGSEFPDGKGPQLTIIKIGEWSEINVFQIDGNTEADRQTPMFGRGRIDHLALQAASLEAFDTIRARLMDRGAADDSSPTSAPCSVSSSGIQTVSNVKCVSRTRTTSPASSTPPEPAPSATRKPLPAQAGVGVATGSKNFSIPCAATGRAK
jgi:hypothetical protein